MIRNEVRKAKLLGVRAAEDLHEKLNIKSYIRSGATQVDVLGAIEALDIPTLFRPLDGLLGVYIPQPIPGILISTKRRAYIQKYTAAHELGHYCLEHGASYDDEKTIGGGSCLDISMVGLQEIQAESFASAFLIPKLLIVKTTKRANWKKSDLKDPFFVYQMAVRMGVSYRATWIALKEYDIISANDAARLEQVEPKQIKRTFNVSTFVESSWSNILFITLFEYNLSFEVEEGDAVVLETPSREYKIELTEYLKSVEGIEVLDANECPEITYAHKDVVIFKGIGCHKIRPDLSRLVSRYSENPIDLGINFVAPELGIPQVTRQNALKPI